MNNSQTSNVESRKERGLAASNAQAGAGLIEIVIGAAIIAVALTGVVAAFNLYVKAGLETTTKLRAAYLLEEGIEAARFVRDDSWSTFAALAEGTTYYPAYADGSGWSLSETATTTDGLFTRTVVIDDVYRSNDDDDIVPESSGEAKTLDPDTKKVTATVSWGSISEQKVSFESGTTDGTLTDFPSSAGYGNPAQSITTGSEAFNLGSVELLLRAVSNPSDIYLEVRSESAVGPVVSTSDTIDSSTISGSGLEWTTFTFVDQPELAASTTYWLRLRSTPPSTEVSGASPSIRWGYEQTGSSPYAGGVARRYVGASGNESDEGQELTQYDFSFRTHSIGGGGEVTAVTYLANIFE